MNSQKPGHLYWSKIEPHWDRLTGSWDHGPAHFLATMKDTPVRVQHLYAAHWCISEACNGGFHQFFFNSTGILAPEAANGFAAIGATDLAEVTLEAMSYFGPTYPRDRARRQGKLPDSGDGPRDQWDPFTRLDDRFYALLETMDWDRLADHYAADA
jgi:hypothetical protein